MKTKKRMRTKKHVYEDRREGSSFRWRVFHVYIAISVGFVDQAQILNPSPQSHLYAASPPSRADILYFYLLFFLSSLGQAGPEKRSGLANLISGCCH